MTGPPIRRIFFCTSQGFGIPIPPKTDSWSRSPNGSATRFSSTRSFKSRRQRRCRPSSPSGRRCDIPQKKCLRTQPPFDPRFGRYTTENWCAAAAVPDRRVESAVWHKKRLHTSKPLLTNVLGDTRSGTCVGRLPSLITTWNVRYSPKKTPTNVITHFDPCFGKQNYRELVWGGCRPSSQRGRCGIAQKNAYLGNLF